MKLSENRSYQHVTSDVEFSVSIKQWRDILLHQTALSLFIQLLNGLHNWLFSLYNTDALSSVGILPGFYDKERSIIEFFISENFLNFLFDFQVLILELAATYVESFGYQGTFVNSALLTIRTNILKQVLFIRNFFVVFQMVVDKYRLKLNWFWLLL